MGFGDALLQAGMAEKLFREHPERGPILICGCDGHPRWREEWQGNPAIRRVQGHHVNPAWPTLRVGGGCLPYHPWHPGMTWRARDHRANLYFTEEELQPGVDLRAKYGRFLLIEPTGRDRLNMNRSWGSERWARLAAMIRSELPEWPLLQMDRPAADRLPGVIGIPHASFREACAILKAAHLGILTEGGITIGAATVGTPAVVLWGGMASVELAGYPEHVNIVDTDPESPCERSKPCAHCVEAWRRLTPEMVLDAVRAELARLETV